MTSLIPLTENEYFENRCKAMKFGIDSETRFGSINVRDNKFTYGDSEGDNGGETVG